MRCSNCGEPIEEGRLFCLNCGQEVQWVPDYDSFGDYMVQEKLKKELERIKAVPSGIIRKLPVKRKQPLPVNPTLSNKARKKKRLQTGVAYGRS